MSQILKLITKMLFLAAFIFMLYMQLNIKVLKNIKEHIAQAHSGIFEQNRLYPHGLIQQVYAASLEEITNNNTLTAKQKNSQKVLVKERKRSLYSKSDSGKSLKDKITHMFRIIYEYAQGRSQAYLPASSFGLMWGSVMGDDKYLSDEQRNQFSLLGIQHLTAASGYNVQILVASVGLLLSKRRSFIQTLLLSFVIFLYTGVCSFQPSLLRASIQWGISAWSSWFQRPIWPFSPLLVSVLIIAILQPELLGKVGLQLSVAATFGILLFGRGGGAKIQQKTSIHIIQQSSILTARKIKFQMGPAQQTITTIFRYVQEVSRLSLAASIFTIPIILYQFGEFSPWFLIGNLSVQWLMSWVTLASALYILIACVSLPASHLISAFLQLPAELALTIVRSVALAISSVTTNPIPQGR